MSPRAAKILVRTIGTFAGTCGLYMLVFSLFMLGTVIQHPEKLGLGLFVVIPLLMAWYGLYVGWLVWRRLSPLAVRHVCGLTGFAAFVLFSHFLMPNSRDVQPEEALWNSVFFLGALLLANLLYRVVSERLNCVLFPMAFSSE